MISGLFSFIGIILIIVFIVGEIKPQLLKNKQGIVLSRKQIAIRFLSLAFLFFILSGLFSSSSSPASLSSWISVSNQKAQTQLNSLTNLTEEQKNELAGLSKIPNLVVQDKWNNNMGYFEYLSPETYTQLSDQQVKAVLNYIQDLRKKDDTKWFNVMVFDDPNIAKEARTADYSNLSEEETCNKFLHYRGAYSWNPTNKYEQVNLMINCNWKEVLK